MWEAEENETGEECWGWFMRISYTRCRNSGFIQQDLRNH